ncbi:MAG: MerR family transcriptional regulator [Eubacterium sp.]|nr:MerR family transcriptional regulator [Eubacterium sp.]
MESINRRLSISEMAQIHDISRQTLIYYDKIGLFEPAFVDEETGYRYYSTLQIPLLREICFLKSIGMPLDAIRTHNKQNNLLSSIELLEAQDKKITKQIETLQKQQQLIEQRVTVYRKANDYENDDLKPHLQEFPERYLLYYPWQDGVYTRQELHLTLMKIWNLSEGAGYLPSRHWGALIFKSALESGDPFQKAGGCCVLSKPFTLPVFDKKAQMVTLPAGEYVCLPKFGMPYDETHLFRLMSWIKKNNYEVCGDIYDECLLDAIFYGGREELDFCEIQVPVKKK